MKTNDLNAYCAINKTGYGVASLNILKELYSLYNLVYFPIGKVYLETQQDVDFVKRILQNQENFNPDANCLKIWHQFDLANRIGSKKSSYSAMSFFELDTLNKLEILHINCAEQIFVTSEWYKRILENHKVKPKIKVVPLGVDRNIFNPDKYDKPNNEKYVFLNLGKWEVRKGHDFLYDLIDKAFPDRSAELWLMPAEHTNTYTSKEETEQWHNLYNKPNVKIFPTVKDHSGVAELISKADCCIFPSKAEGWNMELLESMSMGKPVITTNYSAHTEFCTKDNSYLVDIDETESAYDGKAFRGQGNWAKIGEKQIDMCIDYMRYLCHNRVSNNPEGINTAKKFSWSNTANLIKKYIG